ncbi:hypothetical protein SAMN05192534_106161 [Alteribacillus persepolensis]|uniref:Uncharacterized protein n=1 Tax=Alteribacillus persepolensis TaxID=568899 RepID=A0A1G8D1U5_9BACI|nr:hypothetical protein [Alteribacillus persepolensis]SDH51735.1 hypothetical protein SAMN05192534_106161 [Alteribacillus persepolensis]
MEIWKILLVTGAVLGAWPMIKYVSLRRKWTAVNFQNNKIPYTLGFLLFFYTICLTTFVYPVENQAAFFIYISGVWAAGWMDDTLGTAFPKGIKGHIRYFVKHKEWTTGLSKIVLIVLVSALTLYLTENTFSFFMIVHFIVFVLSPHVCNSFDTRPLRVWKWTVLHLLILLLFVPVLSSAAIVYYILLAVGIWGYLEMKKKAMLGDNGAALAGGFIAWWSIHAASFSYQLLLAAALLAITYAAEKVSLHAFIKNVRILKYIDYWGRKEGFE